VIDAIVRMETLKWQALVEIFDSIKNAIASFIDSIQKIAGRVGWMFGFGTNKMPGLEESPLKRKNMPGPSIEDGYKFSPMRFEPGSTQQPQLQQIAGPADGRGLIGTFEGIRNAIAVLVDRISPPDSNPRFPSEGGLIPARFSPGSNQQRPQPVSLSLNIDGRTLAQVISELQSSQYEFPGGAPAPNGLTAWNDGDHNFATT
jgi:hypothetical protein